MAPRIRPAKETAIGASRFLDELRPSAAKVVLPARTRWIQRVIGAPAPRVQPSVALLGYVGVTVALAAAWAIRTVPGGPVDVPSLTLVSVVAFGMEVAAVRTIADVRIFWSAIGFVCLAAGFFAGPPGVLATATAGVVGGAVGRRYGWLKFAFNVAELYVSYSAAWLTFSVLGAATAPRLLGALIAGAAGAVSFVVNVALLAGVARLSDRSVDVAAFGRSSLVFLPFSAGYGWAAYGAVLLHDRAGALGLSFLLVPVILVQLFLVILGQRVAAQDRQRRAHAEEREQLLRRVLDASDAERRRIARDLHDGVVQELAVLAQGLGAEARRSQDPRTVEAAGNATLAVREAMEELRTLLRDLAPPNLAAIGLRAALDDMTDTLRDLGIVVDLDVADDIDRVAQITALYRISQEAVRNITKHARAQRVTIRVWRDGENARLEIGDDGVGFDTALIPGKRREGHMGAQLLSDLAIEAQGTLSLTSHVGRGTQVSATIPMSVTVAD